MPLRPLISKQLNKYQFAEQDFRGAGRSPQLFTKYLYWRIYIDYAELILNNIEINLKPYYQRKKKGGSRFHFFNCAIQRT